MEALALLKPLCVYVCIIYINNIYIYIIYTYIYRWKR